MTSTTAAVPAAPSPQDRPLVTRRGAAWGTAAAAFVVLGLAVLVIRDWPPLLDLDQRMLDRAHRWALAHDGAVALATRLESLALPWAAVGVAALTLVVLLAVQRYWAAATLVLLSAGAPAIAAVLATLVDRPRPEWTVPLATAAGPSFPSMQATLGVAVYAAAGVSLGLLLRSRAAGAVVALPFLLLALAMGAGGLVLGVVHPSDVIAGWCVALGIAALGGWLFVLPPHDPHGHGRVLRG